jgi:hypothetical protein
VFGGEVFTIWVMLMCSAANAGTLDKSLAAATDSLKGGNVEQALSLLAQSRMSVPNEDKILSAATIGQLLYLEGLAPRVMGAERDEDIDKWRDALTVYPTLQWNRDILDSNDLRGFFEALRAEVAQREAVPTGVPERRGKVRAFVDGVEHMPMQAVRAGPHVAQVQCPDGSVNGKWTRFESKVDWVGLCGRSVDLNAEPIVVEVDEFAEIDPRAGPEPLVWVPPLKERKVRTDPLVSKRTLLISAGTAVALSGITYTAAYLARRKYDNLDGGLQSPSELASQRRKTNTLVGVSGGLFITGAGLYAAGQFQGTW